MGAIGKVVERWGAAEGASARRVLALDLARGVGVLAMVAGHTLDAVLSPLARQAPGMARYWQARGFTAPLFLAVSGWAVALAIVRSGKHGWSIPGVRVRRVVLLLAIGYLLRWPGWGLDRLVAGDPEVWRHLLAFDALHCIGASLLLTALTLGVLRRTTERVLALGGLLVAAVLLGAKGAMPGAVEGGAAAVAPSPLVIAWVQAVGGTSPFPVTPWSAYFFAGALLGILAPGDRRAVPGLALLGASLVAAAYMLGLGGRGPAHPVLFAYRIGVVLALLAALAMAPHDLARQTAQLGRHSLGVYALHVPIVYGWSTWPGLSARVGPSLGLVPALVVAALVLLSSLGVATACGAVARALQRTLRAAPGSHTVNCIPTSSQEDRLA